MADLLLLGGGRMGGAILELTRSSGHQVAAVVRGSPTAGTSPPEFGTLAEGLDRAPGAVVLDFSVAEGAAGRIRLVGERGCALVQGTTGLDDEARKALRDIAREVAVVEAPNTSPGIALLRQALDRVLGRTPSWDIAITDRHHRDKRDAPSGTARLLADEIAAATGRKPEIASHRQGGVVGEHMIVLSSPEEELILGHRALSRSVFARGALIAADFCMRADAGYYTMSDVLAGDS